eukprot:762871-Hanusia_phi.AAC.2
MAREVRDGTLWGPVSETGETDRESPRPSRLSRARLPRRSSGSDPQCLIAAVHLRSPGDVSLRGRPAAEIYADSMEEDRKSKVT